MLAARAWVLVDATSGARLAAFEPLARLEPASLTKLMTAYVVFTALNENRIALTDTVTVSPAAFATPGKLGARMYLEPGRAVTVDQLLRGMLTVSASDAAVALAEHSAGSVDAFVARMNAEVRRLGMANTHFANPTGQSDAQNYSSAEDMAILARRLLTDFPQHAPLFAQREFAYNNVSQANRNRLLWTDSHVDGMKTGQLSASGWSVVATTARAQGDGERAFQRRLIAVVLGAASDAARTQETLRLINHGYAAFDTVQLYRRGDVLAKPAIWKGDRGIVPVGVDHDVYVTVPASELRDTRRRAVEVVDRALRSADRAASTRRNGGPHDDQCRRAPGRRRAGRGTRASRLRRLVAPRVRCHRAVVEETQWLNRETSPRRTGNRPPVI